ncbi:MULTISPECIES: Tm-1-like ATP-binding domain-containing protein [unclassified Mesorhizobium]|uniref:Tm-1-like ATP-binding domain-containing protein n=1 Tax=unclassified Mesorhizobium TaxID=325217 RepID=UPI001CCD3D37|nr:MULTISPECIES: Tm-1-like ATP-binding domain-containing protein [unclassified Mesorhizobium]MBZ9741596.1 Tm-1-like ATP-binding domain-containing protein [Mesorhizobium sp. CO1-1-4]MBZ9805121.1 Tm-1-like ATP-binding domain-containing protein [Mesorhizobium sp. ES1-6]
MKRVYVVGTADTKGEELGFLADAIAATGALVCRVDVGTREATISVDIGAKDVAAHHPAGGTAVLGGNDRGAAVAAMGVAFTRFIQSRNDIAGVIGIGGGGGTSIITAGMRALPLGLPKIMVSTLASGDTAPYVDVSDIIMMPSVTDMAGLNRLSRVVLHNAAQAISGMAGNPAPAADGKASIGLTMFGVTTPCVTAIADQLRDIYDCMVFHATGTGGRSMEKLADSGLLSGVIDITTTEVCDLLFGGVLPAAQDRFGAVARTGLPYVGSVGALDMVNFWAPSTIPERYRGRLFYEHNPNVTLMRTTARECRAIGEWIGAKLALCKGPVHFLIPEKGVSALDIEGGAFFDPEADAALFEAIERTIRPNATRRVTRLPLHINDPEFAQAATAAFLDIARQ